MKNGFRFRKTLLSLLLCAALVLGMGTSAFAEGPGDFGLSVSKNDSYLKDGKFYMSFTIKTGELPMANETNTKIKAELFNSSGKRMASWNEKTFEPNKKITRNYGYDWNSNLPSGTYTMKITCTLDGDSYSNYHGWAPTSYSWSYKVNHKAPSSIYLDSATVVTRDDGSYANRIKLGHSGCKGKFAHVEIYDQKGNMVMSGQGNKAISNDKGTYSFTWGGFPKGGGLRCESGNYTIKFWVTEGNPKQSTVWLDIY